MALEKKGWALKRTGLLGGWKKRFLALDPYTCRLLVFKDPPPEGRKGQPLSHLDLSNCTFMITSGVDPEEEQCRFTIIAKDKKQQYNLQVNDRKQLKEWTHAVHILSKLGWAKDVVIRENRQQTEEKENSRYEILRLSAEKLLRGFERTADKSREGLTAVTEQKCKAIARLEELLKSINKGQSELQKKGGNLQMQEQELRQRMHFLNQKEFFLQHEVAKSNQLQDEMLVHLNNLDDEIERRAKMAVKNVCATTSAPKHRPTDSLFMSEDEEKNVVSKQPNMPEPTNFRLEMYQLLVEHFPSCRKVPVPKNFLDAVEPSTKVSQSIDPIIEGDNETEDIEDADYTDVERSLLFFHDYFTKVHVAHEDRLLRVRTQCQQKYHKLKSITTQRGVISREQEELTWIAFEIDRAIKRLTKEGIPLGPREVEDTAPATVRQQSPVERGAADDDVVPIRAHRATWSEASDVIFKLNFNRQEQFERTEELDGALRARESLREFVDALQQA